MTNTNTIAPNPSPNPSQFCRYDSDGVSGRVYADSDDRNTVYIVRLKCHEPDSVVFHAPDAIRVNGIRFWSMADALEYWGQTDGLRLEPCPGWFWRTNDDRTDGPYPCLDEAAEGSPGSLVLIDATR